MDSECDCQSCVAVGESEIGVKCELEELDNRSVEILDNDQEFLEELLPQGPESSHQSHPMQINNVSLEEPLQEQNILDQRPKSVPESSILKPLGIKCPLSNCKQLFANKPELDHHLRLIHAVMPFRCWLMGCNQAFFET